MTASNDVPGLDGADTVPMRPIARIRSEFGEKFGVPRQAGLVPELQARVEFEPEFRDPNAVAGLEGFSHVWLVWVFSLAQRRGGSGAEGVPDAGWSPTVRPPRLGGSQRLGVFATRSPFRPNPIGLSSVRLDRIDLDARLGPVLHVRGADLVDGTPILDVKPYVPADAHPDASAGFVGAHPHRPLDVEIPEPLLARIPVASRDALRGVLAHDPRPPYQRDPERVYGMVFAGCDVRFLVDAGVVRVVDVSLK